jgi:hypothetical protein
MLTLIHELALLDDILAAHAEVVGRDLTAYRNHAYRVVNWCAALSRGAAFPLEIVAIAAAFHDLGIWTARTFDYLPPSILLARAYMADSGRAGFADQIEELIGQHHKILPYRRPGGWLVDAFRRADWIDLSFGWSRPGLPRSFRREVWATFPRAGFHGRLVQFGAKRLLTHPLRPLPMLRW